MDSLKNPLYFFKTWKKRRAMQSQIQIQIRPVIINQLTDKDEINKQMFYFCQSLFWRKVQNQTDKVEAYLEHIPLPKLTNEQTLINHLEMVESLKNSMNASGMKSKNLFQLLLIEYF